MKHGEAFVWVILGSKGDNCLLFHPFLTRSPTRLNKGGSPVGNRDDYSPGRDNWHGFGKGQMR
jgi:hypothetical protein